MKSYNEVSSFCIFIGYPRSGHSLVGSILDAHPHAIVSHELDAIAHYKTYSDKTKLYNDICILSEKQALQGRISYGYQYRFNTLMQGKADPIKVIGDKKGSGTTHHYIKDETCLNSLQTGLQIPLKLIHVTRNPFDIITTKASYENLQKCDITTERINNSIEVIRKEAETNQALIDSNAYDIFSMRYEDLILQTDTILKSVFNFLNLQIDSFFISEIKKNIYPEIQMSRNRYNWDVRQINEVNKYILTLPVFSSYSYE